MNPFLLIFICLPALEIYLLIKVGGHVGALNTVALIFLTAVIGLYFAKHQSMQTFKSGMVNLYQNKLPFYMQRRGCQNLLPSSRRYIRVKHHCFHHFLMSTLFTWL